MPDEGHHEAPPATPSSSSRFAIPGMVRSFRGRKSGALQRVSDSELALRCLEAGVEIQGFVTDRASGRPRPMLRQLPEAEWAVMRSKQLNHDLVTRRFFRRHFSGNVSRLVTELKRREHMQHEDTLVLNFPEDMTAIVRVSGRLVQLGTRLQERQHRTSGDLA